MIDRQYTSYCFLASELSIEKKKYSKQVAYSQSMGFAIKVKSLICIEQISIYHKELEIKETTETAFSLSFLHIQI
jgi:hypothetical protein